MELAEQFKEYALDKDTNVLAWFHALTQKEQKSLKKDILAIHEQLSENKFRHQMVSDTGMTSYTQVRLCGMYIFSLNQYWQNLGGIPNAYWKQQYYKTFRPSWINQLIANTWDMQYPMLCKLLGYDDVTLEPAVIVDKITSTFTFNSWNNDDKKTHQQVYDAYFKSQPLFLEHIWLLFSEPTDMAYGDIDGYITDTFIKLTQEKKIDRPSVLAECLLTAGSNFNKNNTGWFFKLFSALEPTPAELKQHEPSLLLALNCPFSKPQNEALKHLKTLAKEGQINPTTFIEASSSTLSSDVKSVVTSTIAIIEAIGKQAHKAIRSEQDSTQNKELLQTCCDTLCQGFMLKDEKIQTRIAKFIVKYGDTSDTSLSENISSYAPELFSSVQTLLADFLHADAVNDNQMDNITLTIAERIREDNVITLPQTFDDKIYFLNQAFDNNEPYHFDVYLNVIVSLYNELTVENVHRLLPVIQKLNKRGVDWQTSIAEKLMGVHFIHVIAQLVKRFKETDFVDELAKDKKLNEGYFNAVIGNGISSFQFIEKLDRFTKFHHNTFKRFNRDTEPFNLYFDIIKYSHEQYFLNDTHHLPLLSLPTHAPCFVDIETFIKRVLAYHEQDIAIDTTDFQLAISRLSHVSGLTVATLTKTDAFKTLKTVNPLIADICYYMITAQADKSSAFDVTKADAFAYWLPAVYSNEEDFIALTKHHNLDMEELTAKVSWQSFKTNDWTEIKYSLDPAISNDTRNIDKNKKIHLYQQQFIQTVPYGLWAEETANYEKQFVTSPNNAHVVYLKLVCATLGYDEFNERIANRLLNLQFALWQKHTTDAGYIYFAMMLLHSKNTVKQLAGELWLKTIQEQNVETIRLGTFMGKLLHDDFAPLKRFTDLLTQQLMNVSNTHNQALIELISHMIAHMNNEPIKGTKKLLELYLELLTITKTGLPDIVDEKFTVWGETKSLKATIKKLNSL